MSLQDLEVRGLQVLERQGHGGRMLIGGVITAAFGPLILLVFYLFGADRPVIRDLPPVFPAGISLVLLMTGGLLDLLGFLMRRSSPK